MILTGSEIKERLGTDIKIDPFDEKRLGPNSYDMLLHDTLGCYTFGHHKVDGGILDCKKNNKVEFYKITNSGSVLLPGKLYLGRTVEWTETNNFVPKIDGVSSIGRLGLSVHVTAGFGDIGFKGFWTLEMSCVEPVRIYPGMRIAQIYYHTVCGDIKKTYDGKYQGGKGVEGSKSYLDFEEDE